MRSRRDTDTFFKRFTAEGFYHVMNALGADIVFNHADYRLIRPGCWRASPTTVR